MASARALVVATVRVLAACWGLVMAAVLWVVLGTGLIVAVGSWAALGAGAAFLLVQLVLVVVALFTVGRRPLLGAVALAGVPALLGAGIGLFLWRIASVADDPRSWQHDARAELVPAMVGLFVVGFGLLVMGLLARRRQRRP